MVSNRGFSLIELLITMAIIATLASLVVASVSSFSTGSKRAKTDSILGAVRSGLEMSVAEQGAAASPAEHPLAGSREPRPIFVRAAGGSVAQIGVALSGVPLAKVQASAQARVLLADDCFADVDVPQLYGVARFRLGVLGVPQMAVTRYRKLPQTITSSANPDDLSVFPDSQCLVASSGIPADQQVHLDRLIGTTAISELAALGALRLPPSDYTTAIIAGRVLTNGADAEHWKPDHVRSGSLPSGQPAWKPYRLMGMAIYDGWGTEILYSVRDSGMSVMSAGPDRVFRFHPGGNGIFETAANALSPAGDDRDGSADNRVQGAEK